MKTAISIPDNIFQAAERYAKSHGVSRSKLYSQALAQFLKKNSEEEITKKLNEIYSHQPSTVNEAVATLQFYSLEKEEW